jgi:hypothetical protein
MAAKDAEAMPFPKEETTPPVTNTKRGMVNRRLLNAVFGSRHDGKSD